MGAPKDILTKGAESRFAGAESRFTGADVDREECVHSLWHEKEYWCTQAADMKRHKDPAHGDLLSNSQRKTSELSTSQSPQGSSENSHTPWSDSFSDVSGRSHAIDV